MGKILILVTILMSFAGRQNSNKPNFKHFGQIAYFFESKEEMANFFDFKKNEIIAEIGSGDGLNILDLTLQTDSVIFYLQDIDSLVLSEKNFAKIIGKSKRLKKSLTNKYLRIIGTPKSTNLQDNSFDKIILVMTFHEFEFVEEMLSDIYKKLNPTGKLYILEQDVLNLDIDIMTDKNWLKF